MSNYITFGDKRLSKRDKINQEYMYFTKVNFKDRARSYLYIKYQ